MKDDQWTHYYMHNSDLASNDIRVILTQGNGPALPKPISKKPGLISGLLVKDNKPLANVKVEVCVRLLGFFYKGDAPCASQPFFKSALTDKAGKFKITDLRPSPLRRRAARSTFGPPPSTPPRPAPSSGTAT